MIYINHAYAASFMEAKHRICISVHSISASDILFLLFLTFKENLSISILTWKLGLEYINMEVLLGTNYVYFQWGVCIFEKKNM